MFVFLSNKEHALIVQYCECNEEEKAIIMHFIHLFVFYEGQYGQTHKVKTDETHCRSG